MFTLIIFNHHSAELAEIMTRSHGSMVDWTFGDTLSTFAITIACSYEPLRCCHFQLLICSCAVEELFLTASKTAKFNH